MRTAVAYLRSATSDADGLRVQRQAIDTWAEREQIAIVAYHVDAGIGGHLAPCARTGFAAALAEVQPGRLLVVASPDRLARSPAQVARLAASLAQRGSELACATVDLHRLLSLLQHGQSALNVPAEG